MTISKADTADPLTRYEPETTQDVNLTVESLAVDLLVKDVDDLLDRDLLLAFSIEGFGDL